MGYGYIEILFSPETDLHGKRLVDSVEIETALSHRLEEMYERGQEPLSISWRNEFTVGIMYKYNYHF